MGKQVTRCNNNLFVKTRFFDDKIEKVVVSHGKVGKAFYFTPEKAFSDPDYLDSINLMGYRLIDLIIVAERLKAGGVDVTQLKDYRIGFIDGYARAQADINEALQASIEKVINGG